MFLSVIAVSFAACLVLTPTIGAVARRIAFVDHPDSDRKLHVRPTPLGGGVALFVSLLLSIGVAYIVPGSLRQLLLGHRWAICGLLLACFAIMAIGLADDRYRLRGWHKLVGQLLSAGIVLACGLHIDSLRLFACELKLGYLAVPFTLFWLVGAINSINLLDGIDGLASSVGIVLSVTVSILGALYGHPADALAGLALAASLVAFSYFNFHPARIFLGDTGSMLIGLLTAVLTLRALSHADPALLIVPALAIWAIPVFDTAMAIARRKLAGRTLYATDREHLHHCLLRRYNDQRVVVGIIVICCATTCLGAICSARWNSDLPAALSVLLVLGGLIATRSFGYAEALQLAGYLRTIGVRLKARMSPASRQSTHADGRSAVTLAAPPAHRAKSPSAHSRPADLSRYAHRCDSTTGAAAEDTPRRRLGGKTTLETAD